jgi:Uncharacterised nucleotidyltransferase
MARIPQFRKAVVAFLATSDAASLSAFTDADWERQFRWLDRSGLALPLAARLLESEAILQFPSGVVRALTVRLCDNEGRMKSILDLFGKLHANLTDARVSFCCLKGFSLMPEVCGFIRERHQVDIDLLIDPGDASRAVAAVEPLGYLPSKIAESGEIRLTRPLTKHLTAGSWLYDISEGPALEFHTRLWEPESGLFDFPIPPGYMSNLYVGTIAGVAVPRLAPAWQFVSLVLHIFRHLLDSWVRLLSLHEVAVYLRSMQKDDYLWNEVTSILEQDTRLSSAGALVLHLVKREFSVELPASLQEFCGLHLTAQSNLWCKQFSQEWLYADPPGTKLSLLVQRQFCASATAWRSYLFRRLFPRRTPPKLSDEASTQVQCSVEYQVAEALYRVQRTGYHITSDWRFLMAAARWTQLIGSRTTLPIPGNDRTDQRYETRTSHSWQVK